MYLKRTFVYSQSARYYARFAHSWIQESPADRIAYFLSAPLELLEIKKPAEMTGQSLLSLLRKQK